MSLLGFRNFDTNLIKKGKLAFTNGLIFGGRKCLHATSQKRALFAHNFVNGELSFICTQFQWGKC